MSDLTDAFHDAAGEENAARVRVAIGRLRAFVRANVSDEEWAEAVTVVADEAARILVGPFAVLEGVDVPAPWRGNPPSW